MLVVAPVTSAVYHLFDYRIADQSWFYLNYYFLFFSLCPHLSMVAIYTGLFFLFPRHSKRAYFIAVPLTLTIAKILWLITVTTNAEFHQVVPLDFYAIGLVMAALWLFASNYLADLRYHKFDGIVARILGLARLDMDPMKKAELLEEQIHKLRDFHRQY